MTTRCCCWGRYSPYTKLLALEERALNADTPIIVGADAEDPPDATAPPARPALNAHFGDPALAALLPARSAAMAINFDLTLIARAAVHGPVQNAGTVPERIREGMKRTFLARSGAVE